MMRFAALSLVLISLMTAGCGREKKLTSTSPEAIAVYTEGVGLWEKFYYPEAKAAFEKALAADSTFAMAWCRLALVESASQDIPDAQLAIRKALLSSAGATRREQLFIRMWGKRIDFKNEEAATLADSLLALYPDEKEAYLFRGNLYEEIDEDYDAALRFYRKAVAADSGYAQAVMSLGYAYSNLGDQPRAVEQMQHYIALAPNAADPRASYGDLLLRAGRYDEALDQYHQSLQLKSDYWYSIRQIGLVHAILGRLRLSEEETQRGLALLPASHQIEAVRLAADASLDLDRNDDAAAAEKFREALVIDTTNGTAAYGLVRALARQKEFGAARELLLRIHAELHQRNLLHAPAMLDYHLARALVLTAERNLDEAREACDSAIQYSTPLTRPSIYRQIAEIASARGDYEAALEACEEALRVNPNSPRILLTLTKVYYMKGDSRLTGEIGNRLLSLWSGADPDFAPLKELRRILRTTPQT